MIAMMYLVLTALLALNVSKQMLDSFIVVNESMEDTNENFSAKIEDVYVEFNKQYALNPNKVEEFHSQAMAVQNLTSQLVNYIDSIKYQLIITTENKVKTIEQAKTTPLADLKFKDSYTEPTRFFFERSTDGTNGRSGDLKRAIDAFRTDMLAFMNEGNESDRLGLITEGPYYDSDGKRLTWMQYFFQNKILASDITVLNKLIGEVKSAELDVVTYLFSSVTAEDFKFDAITARVIPKNTYILEGQEYEADILVAAYDTKQDPEVYVLQGVDKITDANFSRATKLNGETGGLKLKFRANREGTYKYAGIVRVTNPTGEVIDYPFNSDYIVAPPSLTVAATKMNVFYIGIDNPVAISVPGMADENISPSITTGALKRAADGNGWIVNISDRDVRATTINARARYEGRMINIGSQDFRVKRLPDPVAEVAGIKAGNIDKNTMLAAGAVIPVMKDFQFDLHFTVNSFTMGTIINGDWIPKNTRGNRFTPDMLNMIRNARRGQKFFLENIQATGPDGITRTLNPISLTIN